MLREFFKVVRWDPEITEDSPYAGGILVYDDEDSISITLVDGAEGGGFLVTSLRSQKVIGNVPTVADAKALAEGAMFMHHVHTTHPEASGEINP